MTDKDDAHPMQLTHTIQLSLVIPVWNDPQGLERLLQQAAEFEIFHEIIVVDDASDQPVGPDVVNLAAKNLRVIWLRSEVRRGAGHARNLGLEAVTGTHVLFFDSDDSFTPEFPEILATLVAIEENSDMRVPVDFAIFKHHDSRNLAIGSQGELLIDANRWSKIVPSTEPVMLQFRQAVELVEIAAYPWNKIYRTAFLRDNLIRCTPIPVHNDIELHWTSFLHARKILAIPIFGAVHVVTTDGSRLTNRRGPERLRVFEALNNVQKVLHSSPTDIRHHFETAFLRFSYTLFFWILENIETEHQLALTNAAIGFLRRSIDRNIMTLVAYRDPRLARNLGQAIAYGVLR